ncbi:MAG: DUF6588 family protein [Bacteroidota bacterium]
MKHARQKLSVLLALLVCQLTSVQAQGDFPDLDVNLDELLNLNEILQATTDQLNQGANDGYQYIGAFLAPLGESLVVGMNNGWTSTALTHNKFGFDLSTTVNVVMVPESLGSFDVSSLGLQAVETDATTLPNIFGGDAGDAAFDLNADLNGETYELASVQALSGVRALDTGTRFFNPANWNNIPVTVPTFNFTLGLIKNTDVSARFVGLPPTLGAPFTAFAWGLAVKHDFKQWIKAMDRMPFSMSALVGYTNSRMTARLDPTGVTDLASLALRGHSATAQVLVSKKLLFFTPYAGVGVNIATSSTRMSGSFDLPVYTLNPDNPTVPIASTSLFDLDALEPIRYNASGVRATVGAQIKLWVFTLYGDYTLTSSGYNLFSFGSGISWK